MSISNLLHFIAEEYSIIEYITIDYLLTRLPSFGLFPAWVIIDKVTLNTHVKSL